tara:strand:- start:5360 stop:5494 length:135 start_codon:yes stop_codon:yes gene_type:complete
MNHHLCVNDLAIIPVNQSFGPIERTQKPRRIPETLAFSGNQPTG